MPNITEIIYALGADNNLLAVTNNCFYPQKAKSKPKIGNAFFINKENILKYKPETIFAIDYEKPYIDDLNTLGIKIHYFTFKNLDDIYKCIAKIGEITNHNDKANLLINNLKKEQDNFKTKSPKRILYLASIDPLVTAGQNSFLDDVILKSGHYNITKNLNSDYQVISLEYIISKKPDLIIVSSYCNTDYLKKNLKIKIIQLKPSQSSYIECPGPRIIQVLKYFSEL